MPPGGTTVSISTSNPIVTVTPSQLMVPGGSLSADFSYATQPVAADTIVEIVASTSDRSRSTRLAVWTVVPMFASYSSERGMPLGNGTIGRFTPGNAIFEASCYASIVSARVTRFDPHDDDGFGSEFGFAFGAPPGVPLRPGVYENTSDNERAGNFMALLVAPSATVTPPCRLIGRFIVHDVAVTGDGQVLRLWVTFEASCAGRAGTIRGDVRLTNPPGSSGIPCTR